MIDEKKLIEELQIQIERARKKCNDMVELNLGNLVAKYNHGEFCYVNALHLVQTQPKVGEWIPCSERLPFAEYGESDCVLCSVHDRFDESCKWIEKLYFDGGNWLYPTGEVYERKVEAWMPLPEPYKEEVTE